MYLRYRPITMCKAYPANLLPEKLACFAPLHNVPYIFPAKASSSTFSLLILNEPALCQQHLPKASVLLSNLAIDMASLSGFEEENLIRSILSRTPQIGEDDRWLRRASFGQSTSLKIPSLSDIRLHWPVMSCIIKALDAGLTAHILSLSGDSVTTKVLTGLEKVANTIIA